MRATLLTATLLVLPLAAGCMRTTVSRPDPVPRAQPLEWGLYQILWSRDYQGRLDEAFAPFASAPDYVMFYRDLGRPFTRHALDAVRAVGSVPIVSLELWRWHDPNQPYLSRIVSGDLDGFLRDWARDAAAFGSRLLLRFGFEANGDWFSWGGDPQAYIAAWRHAHELFAQEGASNVEWVWSPNVMSVPDTPDNDLHHYYPGDAYVDWVGLDGYNFGDDYDDAHRWQSFEEIFDEAVADLARRYPDKPIVIAETGSAPGTPGRKADWMRRAWQAANAMPRLGAVVWFNYDKRREGEPDWRIASSRESLAAFNQTFAAPRDGG